MAAAVESAPIDARLDFFAGTIAGVASLLTGQPFDTIKVRLQTPPPSVAGQEGYRNGWHALGRIVREEKVRGLYKGVMSPMLGIAAINSSVFGIYKLVIDAQLTRPSDEPSLGQIGVAGAASGVVTSLLTTPIERLKILQQSSPSHRPQPSLLSLLRSHSLSSLYRGLTPTILRDLAYGPYFLAYHAVCRWEGASPEHGGEGRAEEVEREAREVGKGRVLVAGGVAGIVGWGVTFPIDVLKTRMQSTPSPTSLPPSHPYATLLSTLRHSYATEGAGVFVRGLGPTLARGVPVNMVCFFVFEGVVDAFR
ncbi:mitochondrial carrier domain-containing protein [Leucosporidium creatinivorum]|uniref:Mitochondrial carrier domain-containing protein n=1 Tax=Leucosporidium creatinivorum TaxID=106004 RepID=A0A1Y2FY68_9BASI|nr:mitochondrial carrier domain-containing protein [Leucosporidium creatinivorum]